MKIALMLGLGVLGMSSAFANAHELIRKNAGVYVGARISGPFTSTCVFKIDLDRNVVVANFVTDRMSDREWLETFSLESISGSGELDYGRIHLSTPHLLLEFTAEGKIRGIATQPSYRSEPADCSID